MITTSKFEKLHNKEVDRSYLKDLLEEAKKEENTNIVFRVSQILNSNPNDQDFSLIIEKYNAESVNTAPYKEALTVNGDLKKGWQFENGSVVKSIDPKIVKDSNDNDIIEGKEILPVSFLAGLEYIEGEDQESLNAPVTPAQIYQMITDKMIKAIEKSSGLEYTAEWDDNFAVDRYLVPTNFLSKKAYRGINSILLKSANLLGVLVNPYFLTFKQIKELKGKLKRGSKGLEVVYFTRLFQFSNKEKKQEFSTYKKDKMVQFLKSKGYDAKQFDFLVTVLPILKYYNVFNGADIEGIDFGLENLNDLDKVRLGYVASTKNTDAKNPLAEAILKHLPPKSAKIQVSSKRGAYYALKTDSVNIPDYKAFKSSSDYYRVLFHELIHSTAHENRLNRDLSGKFGSSKYAKEELIAEFGSVFLSAQAGILWHTNKNHSEYIKNWLIAISLMKKDNRVLMRCASAAQKAVDYLLQVNEVGEPKFYQELIKKNRNVDKKEGKQLVLALNGVSANTETIAFNKQIVRVAKEGFANDHVFIIGTPKKVLKNHIDNFVISFDGRILNKILAASLTWRNLIDLPDYMNSPIAIFKSKISGYVVLTKVKDVDKKPLMLALHINKALKLTKVAIVSIKDNLSIYEKWINEGLALYVNRKSELFNYQKVLLAKKLNDSQNENTDNSLNSPVEDVVIEPVNSVPTQNEKTQKVLSPGPELEKTNIINPEIVQPLKSVIKHPVKVTSEVKNSGRKSLATRRQQMQGRKFELYDICDNDLATFLGDVELKNKESVVLTVAGEQGSGKTRWAFRFMNILAQKYKVGHASMEEHPDSKLYWDKVDEYIDETALNNIDNPEVKNLSQLDKLIKDNDVIVIDSFAKLRELDKKIEVDKDLRKKYDGKLFLIVFQLTSDGSMRGGTSSQFDGDAIFFVDKKPDYKDSFVYANKNRYQSKPLNEVHYNIFQGKLNNNLEENSYVDENKEKELTDVIF